MQTLFLLPIECIPKQRPSRSTNPQSMVRPPENARQRAGLESQQPRRSRTFLQNCMEAPDNHTRRHPSCEALSPFPPPAAQRLRSTRECSESGVKRSSTPKSLIIPPQPLHSRFAKFLVQLGRVMVCAIESIRQSPTHKYRSKRNVDSGRRRANQHCARLCSGDKHSGGARKIARRPLASAPAFRRPLELRARPHQKRNEPRGHLCQSAQAQDAPCFRSVMRDRVSFAWGRAA
jgi:hypothetical protein